MIVDPSADCAHTQPSPAVRPFEVILLRSGLQVTVQPSESIADVLHLAGVALDTVCEQGVCGTCVTPYSEGEPEHRDSCLSVDEQRTHVALCCSGCRSDRLVLDL